MSLGRTPFLIGFVVTFALCSAKITLELLGPSALYLPNQENLYEYNSGVAEKSAFDNREDVWVMYVVGANLLHAIDFEQPHNVTVVHRQVFPLGELTDVATCGDHVAVSLDNEQNPLSGRVYVYTALDTAGATMRLVHEIPVGALPDMLTFTRDCRHLVVAMEGELRRIPGTNRVVDPEGGVEVIHFPDGPSGNYTKRTASFNKFNARASEYVRRGVRWVYRGQGSGTKTHFSQDLEPEYIALSSDQKTAFVVLQENNAIATVDIASAQVTGLHPLGFQSWATVGKGFDASDEDGGAHFKRWDVYRMPQPDTIKVVSINGKDYIFCANEGDEKKYEQPEFPFDWRESRRGNSFDSDELELSVSQNLVDALADDQKLGRMTFSRVDGKVSNMTYERFHSYGGRSWSIYDAKTFELIWDSESEIEETIQRLYPTVFNSDPRKPDESPESSFDSRSDDMGPETEVVEIGNFYGKKVVLVSTERPGAVFVYSIEEGSTSPKFESLHYNGGYGDTWRNLYKQRALRDLGCEDIRYIEEGPQSIGGQPLAIVLGEQSGTVSFYRVYEDGASDSAQNVVGARKDEEISYFNTHVISNQSQHTHFDHFIEAASFY